MSNQKNQKASIQSVIITVIGALVVAVAAYFGVDLSGLIEETEPTTAPTISVPTEVPVIATSVPVAPGAGVEPIALAQGFGAEAGFWQVYFTDPVTSRAMDNRQGGLDGPLVALIDGTQSTLDIAAFEWNWPALNEAVLRAVQRGVTVRMVVDDEHALEEEDEDGEIITNPLLQTLMDAGVTIVDDSRSGLMHNKFMIFDGQMVWTGSMNFTVNGIYRNNNNALVMRSRRAVEIYQAEFNEMFVQRDFGSSRSQIDGATFNQDGVPIQILFSPEDGPVPVMERVLGLADTSIKFMTFSFTLDEVGDVLLEQVGEGVVVEGIFEVRGSETEFSEMPRLFCAGVDVRQDGNPGTFHHKVFIIDDSIVLTGSFNISVSATERNDENMIIISDPLLAAQYVAEFERTQAIAEPPDDIVCD